MGDLTRRAADRGQLLIITALALAVLLSLMAIVLNTAVFGEVHVAQTDDSLQEERGAVEFQNAVRRGVEGVIPPVNERYAAYDTLEGGLGDAVANWTDVGKRQYARDGVAVNASVTRTDFETHVVHDSGDFTDQTGDASWDVVQNASNVSEYGMNVSESNLTETANCGVGGDCFRLNVSDADGSASWAMFVHTTDDDAVAIEVVENDGSTTTCTTDNSTVLIDVTNGSFDGGACSFTPYPDDPDVDPPYTVTYVNADNASGTYELTVPEQIVDDIEDDDRYATTGSPRLDPRIVAANVSVRYQSADLTYRTEIRVTPGETDD